MNKSIKAGDKVVVTRVNGEDLDVPHIATVEEAEERGSVLRTFLIDLPILGEKVLFVDEPEEDLWTPLDEHEKESLGTYWVAGNREVEVGDNIKVLKYNGGSMQRDAVVSAVYHSVIDVRLCEGGNEITLYKDPSGLDEWHFADEDITLDAAIYDEEEALQRRQALAYYEDDAITPSYSEFINSGRGRTLADYTGVEITKDSLGFVSKVDEAISSITAESLDFKEESEDVVNHPSHYGNGRFETIEMIEEITKGYDDGFVAHCVGTAVKYESRAPFKHETPLEDLRKARKYLEFAIEHLERMEDK